MGKWRTPWGSEMGFSIEFSDDAFRGLKNLDNRDAKRIVEKLKAAAREPQSFFMRLAGREECKLRVGDYRIIANVLHKEKRIFVRSLGHRKAIYKKP